VRLFVGESVVDREDRRGVDRAVEGAEESGDDVSDAGED
jgi:hypothetical protein